MNISVDPAAGDYVKKLGVRLEAAKAAVAGQIKVDDNQLRARSASRISAILADIRAEQERQAASKVDFDRS